ncbi:uncharacterized protein LOC143855875 [Tasmannia lanceolata]|uniref:uncharacterized protein LOC143855875 n=1 Tax=Tasmannia lanceolata TaxID=3420 RepID=UPI00406376FD
MINGLIWNIRGAKNRPSRRRLKALSKLHKLNFIVLLEPFLNELEVPKVAELLHFTNYMTNLNESSKIWILWDGSLSMSRVSSNNQALSVEIAHLQSGSEAFMTLIYASCSNVERRNLWSYFRDCSQSFSKAWAVGGDFNALLSPDEKLGGRPPDPASCREFQSAIDGAGLIDAGFIGSKFTRYGISRNGQRSWTRLDRVLTNSQWLSSLPSTSITHLSRTCSDHCPLLSNIHPTLTPQIKPFKFQAMWSKHPQFQSIVMSAWSIEAPGNPLETLSSKLKNTKNVLKTWNREIYGNVFQNVRSNEDRVLKAELDHQSNPNSTTSESLSEAIDRLNETILHEEIFLRQKTKEKWLKERDRNNKFFHAAMHHQRNLGGVTKIRHNGNWITDKGMIKDLASTYFEKALAEEGKRTHHGLLNLIPKLISPADNHMLLAAPSEEEIKEAIFSSPLESAPGPDGSEVSSTLIVGT